MYVKPIKMYVYVWVFGNYLHIPSLEIMRQPIKAEPTE